MKRLSIAFVLLCVGTLAKAQSFHFGLKAGPNLGKISGQSFKDGFEWGYQAGAWATLDLSDKLGIQPEVVFSQTNTKTMSSEDAQIGNILKPNLKAHLNYLSIPVLLNINTSDLLTLQLGPQFSINTSKGSNLVQDGKDAFKGGDVAAVGGIQLNLSKFRIYGRYVIGITKINDVATQEKWRSQNFQFGLGYKIF
ncbi:MULTISPECIES: porin family protein [Chitinophagaceae]